MKEIFKFWWSNGNKVFQATNYRKAWKEVGNKPRLCLHHNGAKRSRGDSCFDISLIVGYTVISYTNFNLQRMKCTTKSQNEEDK
jgi:hypothetical protein